MGCKTLWDKGNEPGVPKCTTAEHYRSKNILLSDVYVPSGIYVFALLFHVTYPSMHFIYFYIHSRNYDNISKSLSKAELREISRLTGCQKPCKYRRYIMVGDRKRTSFKSDDFTFSLWAVSKSTEVKKEELIYPLSSLVADFGGSLSLFLGVSFMTLWDQIKVVGNLIRALHLCKHKCLGTKNKKAIDCNELHE